MLWTKVSGAIMDLSIFFYISRILSIEIQKYEIEHATALTKIYPFWGNGGFSPFNGDSCQKREFYGSHNIDAVGFRCSHGIFEGFVAVLDNTYKKFNGIVLILALGFLYSN